MSRAGSADDAICSRVVVWLDTVMHGEEMSTVMRDEEEELLIVARHYATQFHTVHVIVLKCGRARHRRNDSKYTYCVDRLHS